MNRFQRVGAGRSGHRSGLLCETGPAPALLLSRLQSCPLVTDQVCACPNEQCAQPLAGTSEPQGMDVALDSRKTWARTLGEEILMSRLGESAEKFGVHQCSLGTERI